jgi:YHS domain-containing protein
VVVLLDLLSPPSSFKEGSHSYIQPDLSLNSDCGFLLDVEDVFQTMKNRFLFLLLLTVSLFAFGQGKSNPKPEKDRDPVCGIMVVKDPGLSAEYQGQTYYFCSIADREKFKQNPQKYVKEK